MDAVTQDPPPGPHSWRGAVAAGAVAGAWCGVADGLRAWATAPRPFTPRDFAAAVLAYACLGLLVGPAAAALLRRPMGAAAAPRAAAGMLWIAGSLFIAGRLLPRRYATPSLVLNAVMATGAVLLLGWVLYRGAPWLHRRFPAGGGRLTRTLATPPLLAAGLGAMLNPVPGDLAHNPVALHAGPGPAPNVLVVLVDSLRADRVGAMGGTAGLTPRLDALAATGLSLRAMRTSSPWTKPSVASLHTGLRPERHGVTTVNSVLPSTAPPFLSFFQQAGYRTALLSDSHWPVPEFGFDRGVDSLLVVPNSGGLRGTALWRTAADIRDHLVDAYEREHPAEMRGAPVLARRFLTWARQEDDRPFAAYMHWMEPHHPYAPDGTDGPPRRRVPVPIFLGTLPLDEGRPLDGDDLRDLVANYDDEVRTVDRVFGDLVDGLRDGGLLENSIVLFVSDHGEEFHEHGGWTHGHSLYEEIVHVPCILHLPDGTWERTGFPLRRGQILDGSTRIEDLLPTLLGLAGITTDAPFDGVDLLRPPPEGAPAPAPSLPWWGYCRRISSPTVLRGAMDGGHKLILAERSAVLEEWLFDLTTDPLEHAPLNPPPETATTRALRELMGKAMVIQPLAESTTEIDGEVLKALMGLGYIQNPREPR